MSGRISGLKNYTLRGGRIAPVTDADAIYDDIIDQVKDLKKVRIILRNLAIECLDSGAPKATLSYLDKELFLSDTPDGKASVHLMTGLVFERMRDYSGAVARYMVGLSLHATDGETRYFLNNNLGYCLNQLGRHVEAEGHCLAAIGVDPQRHNAYKNLGVALQGKGSYPEAAASLLKAAYMYPPDSRSLQHLEDLLAKHRQDVERDIPDIAEHIEGAVEAHRRLFQ